MKVLVISGPTATGKTDLAVEVGLKYNGEVVNFDSLLFYKEINIGTAKPTPEERKSVPHHLLDVRSITDPMNAADFSREAFPVVEEILSRGKLPILTGGSGFYLQALLKGMYDSPTTPPEIQKKSDELYKLEGILPFRKILHAHDPITFERYHENDHYRNRRAVEHWWTTGVPLSVARNFKDSSNTELKRPTIHPWDVCQIYLNIPKEEHYHIIEKRTDRMLSGGLIEEVKDLLNSGFTGTEKPLQSIGYKEALEYILGVTPTLSECRERIIISTRQLAKAQRTWFNRDPFKMSFNPLNQHKEIFEEITSFIGIP